DSSITRFYTLSLHDALPISGNFDRLRACPWLDVEWVVGECGIDAHVIGGGEHFGYLDSMAKEPSRYCAWLDEFILGINDSRIHRDRKSTRLNSSHVKISYAV